MNAWLQHDYKVTKRGKILILFSIHIKVVSLTYFLNYIAQVHTYLHCSDVTKTGTSNLLFLSKPLKNLCKFSLCFLGKGSLLHAFSFAYELNNKELRMGKAGKALSLLCLSTEMIKNSFQDKLDVSELEYEFQNSNYKLTQPFFYELKKFRM